MPSSLSEPSWSELLRTVVAASQTSGNGGGGGGAPAPPPPSSRRDASEDNDADADADAEDASARRGPPPHHPAPRSGSLSRNDQDEEERDVEWLHRLQQQLERYCLLSDKYHYQTATDLSSKRTTSGEREDDDESEGRKRRQSPTIRDTRLALRFGAAWVASNLQAGDCGSVSDTRLRSRRRRRERLQQSILEATETCLYRILLANGPSSNYRQPQQGVEVDGKCRLYAARLLCNLVTDNAAASRQVLLLNGGRSLHLDPGWDELRSRQRRALLRLPDEGGGDNKEAIADRDEGLDANDAPAADCSPPNWLDMITNNADHRDVLAAIVATLHNAITAIESASLTAAEGLDPVGGGDAAARRVAGHGLVVNALLRHVVPSQSVVSPLPALHDPPTIDNGAQRQTSPSLDDASDWIMVLLRGLVRRGHLRTLYRAVSERDPDPSSTTSEEDPHHRGYGALPEHVVLLFCLRQQLENDGHNVGASSWLAGLCDAQEDAVESVVFLAELYDDLSPPSTTEESHMEVPSPSVRESTWHMERVAVQLRVLDLLGDLLQDDSDSEELAFRARSAVGQHPNFLPCLSRDLTTLVDMYTQQLHTKNEAPNSDASLTPSASREGRRVTIPPQDQERLTSTVRLLGNLCYRCRPNQDLLRSIEAPASPTSPPSAHSGGRNVLHVLLTSTSLAPYCFTLREWAVVAVRNALEGNAENQSVLSDLQAQQPAPSVALTDMGVRIDLDAATGKVNVVPLDE